jgi:lipopolysaccharide export system protein LptC
MVMKNPELNGVDRQKRPYNLLAKEAIQNPTEPGKVELLQIDAKVPMDDKLYARIIAGTGFYDSEAKTLKLGGEVDVKTDDGMSIKLQDADIDIEGKTLSTKSPISMTSEQATISANQLQVEDGGKRIIFTNRVRMTIYPDKLKKAEANKAAKPSATVENGSNSTIEKTGSTDTPAQKSN